MINWKEVGKRLRFCRISWKLTQTQVSEYLGVKQSQISKLENGTRKLKTEVLEKLCLLYRVDDEWLLYGKGEPTLNWNMTGFTVKPKLCVTYTF